MWVEILVSIATSVGEAIICGIFDKKKEAQRKLELRALCERTFAEFADTSLDCSDFQKTINSHVFSGLIRVYFFSVLDPMSNTQFKERMVLLFLERCKRCTEIEIRGFVQKLLSVVVGKLQNYVAENPQTALLHMLITASNRITFQQIVETKESLTQYIKSLDFKKEICSDYVIDEYHENVKKELSQITFSGISGAELKKSRSLDELYVPNNFYIPLERNHDSVRSNHFFESGADTRIDEMLTIRDIKKLFDINDKIVIIGGAGYGKTTTVNYLFCKYEELYGESRVKIKLNLKNYSGLLVENKTVLDCLILEFGKRIQNANKYDIRQTLINNLCLGKTLVIFDALDEIPTESARHKVRDEITNFTNVYFLNRFVITSREIGYLRNRFESTFLHLRICPFEAEQVKKYTKLWFELNETEGEFEEFYHRFHLESQKSNCVELLRSPIILILALIIFNAENRLPHKRVEFYRKCVDTFLYTRELIKDAFEWTDNGKNILSDSLTIPKVAYYKHQHSADKDYAFTYEELVNAVFSSIEVSSRISWADAIQQFAKYLIERTELIQETDSGIYDFAHKTFGEFFLAQYYANNLDNKQLIAHLVNWIGDSNNDEMAMLVLEVIIANNHTMQHVEVINCILNIPLEYLLQRKWQSARDFLSVLFRIYTNGMLLPRFEEKYYQIFLQHPRYLYLSIKHSPFEDINQNTPVDTIRYIEYVEAYFDESQDLSWLICQFSYLMHMSREARIEAEAVLIKSEIVNACYQLCKSHAMTFSDGNLPGKHLRKNKDPHEHLSILMSFIEKYDVISIPHVFLMILKVALFDNSRLLDDNMINLLCSFRFSENNEFTLFMSPHELAQLVALTFKSPNWFAIVLNAVLVSSPSGNSLLKFIMDKTNMRMEKEQRKYEYTMNQGKRLMELFDNADCFDQFATCIPNKVYVQNFDSIYQEAYKKYKEQEAFRH